MTIDRNKKPTYLIGQKFNRLTVNDFYCYRDVVYKQKKDLQKYWLCECDCGRLCIKEERTLKNLKVVSCGCYKQEKAKQIMKETRKNKGGRPVKDLSGDRYGRLVVLRMVDKDYVECVCDCGNTIICKKRALKRGDRKSCGWLRYKKLLRKIR